MKEVTLEEFLPQPISISDQCSEESSVIESKSVGSYVGCNKQNVNGSFHLFMPCTYVRYMYVISGDVPKDPSIDQESFEDALLRSVGLSTYLKHTTDMPTSELLLELEKEGGVNDEQWAAVLEVRRRIKNRVRCQSHQPHPCV